MDLKKFYSPALYILGGLLSLIIVINIGQIVGAETPEAEKALSEATANRGVNFVMPLIWIAAILSIGFSIFKIAQNKAMLIRFGIGIVLLGIIFLIAYSGSTQDVSTLSTSIPFTGSELQFVGGMVKTLFILLAISVAVMVYAEVKKNIN